MSWLRHLSTSVLAFYWRYHHLWLHGEAAIWGSRRRFRFCCTFARIAVVNVFKCRIGLTTKDHLVKKALQPSTLTEYNLSKGYGREMWKSLWMTHDTDYVPRQESLTQLLMSKWCRQLNFTASDVGLGRMPNASVIEVAEEESFLEIVSSYILHPSDK